jgi:hypothetical protein
MALKLIYLANPTDKEFTVESLVSKERVAARIYELDGKFHHLPTCLALEHLGIAIAGRYIIQEE